MTTQPLNHVVEHLRRSALADTGLTDGQLLDAYLARKDEAAFECLVWRHGPTVLGVCRRVLRNEADAEDAFQATFLVLVRKGHVVRPRDSVGGWLYGVACNVARKARADGIRRRFKERIAGRNPQPTPIDADLPGAIDFELNRLPEKYRAPIVLCELEEQPIADAARALGWPLGTVASRLARGRALLGKRLARQGLGVSAIVTATLTAQSVAGVLKSIRGTHGPANQIADGVLRTMFLAKFKSSVAIALCAIVVLVGGVAIRMTAGEKGDSPKEPAPKAEPVKAEPDTTRPVKTNTLIGRWRVHGDRLYRTIEFHEQPNAGLLIAEKANHDADWFSWKTNDQSDPKTIDVTASVEGAANPNLGIYKVDGERLVIYLGAPLRFQGIPDKHTRPTSFDVEGKTGERYMVLEREMVAWGKPIESGLQFGVLAEPNGRAKVEIGDSVEFRLFVRNTTNKAVDADLTKTDGVPAGWTAIISDNSGREHRVPEKLFPAGVIKAPSRLQLKMLDYQVAELGTVKIRFVDREEGRTTAYPEGSVPVAPGEHTIQFTPNREGRAESLTGALRLTVESQVAWGQAKDGVQFGLALGKGQSKKIHIGERARFRILARNTSDKEVTFAILHTLHLPKFVAPKVESKGDVKGLPVHFVRGPYTRPPPPNLKIKPNETIDLPGEFVLPFLPHQLEGETHVVARTGNWTLSIPKLDTWMTSRDYGTGGLEVEIVPGDVEHTDGQRIAWGPVADGLQFGLIPDKDEHTIGDNVKFTVHARNMSDKELTFNFPTLYGYWPNNGTPIIKDADGKNVKPHLAEPPGPMGPQGATRHTLKVGESSEVTSVWWIFVNRALPGLYKVDYAVLGKPGEYKFQYPDLHGKNKPAWPTGFARLSFKNPAPANAKNAQPKSDADRLLGHWTKDSEKVVGRADWKGLYRMLEFRSQPVSGLMVGHGEPDEEHWFTWKIDATKSPKEIDITARVPGFSIPNFGIYEFDGERLRIGFGAKFLYTGNPDKHVRPTSMATAAHVIELIPGKIAAWGVEKDGLQFGLVAASTSTHLGDSVRFQVNVKNTTDAPKEFEARKVETLPAYVGARAMRGNKVFKTVTALPPGGLPKTDKVAVRSRTTQVVGEFTVHFLPIEAENFGAHIVADAGKCTIDVPDLNGWLTVAGYSTGKVEVELLPWDRALNDSLGVSWGDAVGGLQYGLSHADPAKTEFKHREKMAVKLWARYFGAGSLEVSLPVPDELWQVGRPATVLDAKGTSKQFGMPAPIPREPPGLRKHTLRSGTPVELGTATWPIVDEGPNKAREFGVPTILAVAGTYTIHFPSVGGTLKAGEVPIGTGKLGFTLK